MRETPARERARRRAEWLLLATLLWDGVEMVVALVAGLRASSIALMAFGLDSGIEIAAAGALLWRLRLEDRGVPPERIEHGENAVHRFVGWTFLALAAYVTIRSGMMLWQGQPPGQSLAGIVLAVAALIVMTLLARAKLHAAGIMGSRALRAEAKESLACMFLAAALLFGLAAHAALGWWWADPAAALLMVPWLLREGREALTGEGACCQAGSRGPV